MQVLKKGTEDSWKDGCCVVLVLVVNNVAYVANLGDSKVSSAVENIQNAAWLT
jgi:serine/threonine protein phosphatase PrpC